MAFADTLLESVSSRVFSLIKPLSSRDLTVGEVGIARSVFADKLDTTSIELCTHRLVVKGYAISPNGNIYFHKDGLPDDFSTCSLGWRSWFVHELVHVWQIQQGIKVVRGALFDRRYAYALQVGKDFFQYGIEQQAQMVQDFYEKRERGESCRDLAACIPFLSMTDAI